MPSGKEIRNKIKSVENTRKITKAMEMVAASKMRKAQDRMRAARPYGEKIRRVAANLSHAITEYRHPFLVKHDAIKNVGLILVTSDKGLCGGLNSNALRLSVGKMKEWEASGAKIAATLAALGMLSPVIAGAAMALSSVSVVSNALLLARWKAPGEGH